MSYAGTTAPPTLAAPPSPNVRHPRHDAIHNLIRGLAKSRVFGRMETRSGGRGGTYDAFAPVTELVDVYRPGERAYRDANDAVAAFLFELSRPEPATGGVSEAEATVLARSRDLARSDGIFYRTVAAYSLTPRETRYQMNPLLRNAGLAHEKALMDLLDAVRRLPVSTT